MVEAGRVPAEPLSEGLAVRAVGAGKRPRRVGFTLISQTCWCHRQAGTILGPFRRYPMLCLTFRPDTYRQDNFHDDSSSNQYTVFGQSRT